jgi:hypothetical protein
MPKWIRPAPQFGADRATRKLKHRVLHWQRPLERMNRLMPRHDSLLTRLAARRFSILFVASWFFRCRRSASASSRASEPRDIQSNGPVPKAPCGEWDQPTDLLFETSCSLFSVAVLSAGRCRPPPLSALQNGLTELALYSNGTRQLSISR